MVLPLPKSKWVTISWVDSKERKLSYYIVSPKICTIFFLYIHINICVYIYIYVPIMVILFKFLNTRPVSAGPLRADSAPAGFQCAAGRSAAGEVRNGQPARMASFK